MACAVTAALMTVAPAAWSAAHADPLTSCRDEPDDAKRLACYDMAVGRPPAPPAATAVGDPPPDPQLPNAATAKEPVTERVYKAPEAYATGWELTPQTKRGRFVVRTYQPNYLLPAHYSTRVNHQPESPTQGLGPKSPNYRAVEAKFQISLRTKVAEGLILPDADLWLAYTQLSVWQVWNHKDSAPFRSTDYQPEAIYVVPIPERIGALPGGWRWQMAQFGFAHQSNGQSDPLSRSWNRIYAGAGLTHGNLSVQWRINQRLKESAANDDNPDLTSYIGKQELTAAWLPGHAVASVTWKANTGHLGRGSWQADWSHPLQGDQPQGLRWYVQVFSGYGETLLDYNHRQSSVGFGVSLFQL